MVRYCKKRKLFSVFFKRDNHFKTYFYVEINCDTNLQSFVTGPVGPPGAPGVTGNPGTTGGIGSTGATGPVGPSTSVFFVNLSHLYH
jgi:hypothetical protein